MDLYNEKINEFTDWVDGTNSLTGGNDTNSLPVSGARIRELLQEKLKKPIYIYRDKEAHLYRVFSSYDAWRTWESNPTRYSNLEITNFVAPSEYGVKIEITNGTLNYIRAGVEGLDGSKIKYIWEVSDDKGNTVDENMSVTYTIRENGKSFSTMKRAGYYAVEEELFPYLSMGSNTVDMSFKGVTTGATAIKSVTINVLQLNITTSLDFTALYRNLSTLLFGMYADRNIKGPLSFKTCRYYYGDNTLELGAREVSVNTFNVSASEENNLTPSADYRESGSASLINMKAGMHTVQTWGLMIIDNQVFYSNLLYYIIAVGYELGSELKIDGITLEYELDNRINLVGPTEFSIIATLYEPVTFNWGYIRYVDGKQSNITWYLRDIDEVDSSDKTETAIGSYNCIANTKAPMFKYIPTNETLAGRKNYLVAYRDNLEILAIPIQIAKSPLDVSETTGIDLKLKLSAYGRLNDSSTMNVWEYDGYTTTFTGVKWNEANGWYNNSLRLSGVNSSAVINYNPFYLSDTTTKGITIEIEFESEYVQSTNDELIRIGGSLDSQPHISIFANKASLYIQNNPIITTNYKSNERVKLAFIIEPKLNVSDEIKNVIFIVNNGIAERAAGWLDYDSSVFVSNSGNIKIGGVGSGVRVYNIRCYSKAITIPNAYNNFVYDSENKGTIIAKNNIYESGTINIEKCQEKSDIIIISGNLDKVLERNTTKDGSNTACNIQRINVNDPSKNFTVTHGRIRKHGQSTLNYPLTSYKLWTWSSVDETPPSMIIDASSELPFTKNRYLMKNNSIPANKFVLQANYADSSGVHNGGFLRLIQDTWYNAKFKVGSKDEYKLRTPPQLFTSNQSISLQLGDNNNSELVNNIFRGFNALGNQWGDYFDNVPFPYTIRTAPDSFPCLVFYLNEDKGEQAPSFLGLYVFMDDKKSDFVYGERSIYKVVNVLLGTNNANDPFCVKMDSEGNSLWNEKNGAKIWDNNKVLRIEVLSVNSTLADYRGDTADNSGRRYDNVILGNDEASTSIGWEEDFELVYPEKEDITTSKQFDALKFVNTVQPFTDWLGWLIGTYLNQLKFLNEAAAHLDLYKMAAYYIFVLRFGLVDSLERNAQIKTYDGQHFHYEPWDMDIALGNRNTGGIAFDPPIDRNTMMDSDTAAISGKSRIDTNEDRIADTMVSNWLFDALEAWPYWMEEIVPEVADALFKAGLTYQNVINVLDNDYQDAWCESIYNESGNFKYVVNRQNTDDNGNLLSGYNDSWLAWLQGARTTHRHWWLKTSMDYYDAKWGVGEFTLKRMYFACEMHNVQGNINIVPTSNTYFSFLREATKFGPFEASPLSPLSFNMSVINSGAKVPFIINGANFIKEIDISSIAAGLQVFSVANAYSSEVGPIITKVNIGVPILSETSSRLEGAENRKDVTIEAGNALDAIEELNIRGQKGVKSLTFLNNTKTITKLFAAGSGLNTLTSATGTDYDTLELPDTLTSITFNSTTWNPSKLSFWISTSGGVVTHTYTLEATDSQGNIIYELDGVTPVMEEYTVDEITSSHYDKYTLNDNTILTAIPRNLLSVRFTGTTGKYACARQFLGDWIASIIAWGTEDWNNQTNGADLFSTIDEYLESLFKARTLVIENIYWDNILIPGLSYDLLVIISQFNDIDYTQSYTRHPNIDNFSKGYLKITNVQPLTGIQTSNLLTWFGDGAFTLNSGGLVIDLELDYTAISVGQSAYTLNGEIYLKEGESARISATRFRLQSNLSETSFTLSAPESQLSGTSYVYPAGSGLTACYIEANIIGEDYIYYLKTIPNTSGLDYDVKLSSGANSIVIHIKALDYPEEIFLSAEGVRKTDNVGSSVSSYRYFKTPDLFVFKRTGSAVFGIQFKENGQYVNTPRDANLTVLYVKFKLYKNGVICSLFTELNGAEKALDYTYFTREESTYQTFVDSLVTTLSYTTGYKNTNDTYKYFIPLYVLNSITRTPELYTLTAEIKIGGMVRTLSQDFIIVDDYDVAPAGTALWGLINNAYYLLYSANYDGGTPFYASICYILNGDISIDGLYQSGALFVNVADNLSNLTTLVYNGLSILLSLPNILGIKLDGATSIPVSTESIANLPVSHLTKLKRFSILNCALLNLDIDLTNSLDIEEVDASGTSINVLVPLNPKLTKYELGTPTTISLINPTVLQPNNVEVTAYKNITSIDLVNIPNNKSFTMFDKIMTNYFGLIYWLYNVGSTYNTQVLIPSSVTNYQNCFVTEPIYVGNMSSLKVEYDFDNLRVQLYGQNGSRTYEVICNEASPKVISNLSAGYFNNGRAYYARIESEPQANSYPTLMGTYFRVYDNTDSENPVLLFEWLK